MAASQERLRRSRCDWPSRSCISEPTPAQLTGLLKEQAALREELAAAEESWLAATAAIEALT